MAKFLLFNSDSEAIIKDAKIEEGCAVIDGKKFVVDNSYPFMLMNNGSLGIGKKSEPIYFVKWNCVEPAKEFIKLGYHGNDGKPIPHDEIVFAKPVFKPIKETTPEMLGKMTSMKILGNMIPIKKHGAGLGFLGNPIVLFIIIAVIIFIINYTGVVKL